MTRSMTFTRALLLAAVGCFVGASGAAAQPKATLRGRVVNSWTCSGADEQSCTGVAGVSIFALAPRGREPTGTDCTIDPASVAQRALSGPDGRFELTGLPRDARVRVVYCKLGYRRHPCVKEHRLDAEANVRLFKDPGGDRDTEVIARWMIEQAEWSGRNRPLAECYAEQWKELQALGVPIEMRAGIARAVASRTDEAKLAKVPKLKELARLDAEAFAAARASISDTAKAGERRTGLSRRLAAPVPDFVLKEIFREEFEKADADPAWIALGRDLGALETSAPASHGASPATPRRHAAPPDRNIRAAPAAAPPD